MITAPAPTPCPLCGEAVEIVLRGGQYVVPAHRVGPRPCAASDVSVRMAVRMVERAAAKREARCL